MKKLSLQMKIILLLVSVGVLPLLIYGITYTYIYRGVLLDYEFQKLTAVNEVKKKSLTDLFKSFEAELNVMSDNQSTIDVFAKMEDYKKYTESKGERFNIKSPDYVSMWKKSNNVMKHYRDEFGYYDIFLITSGDGVVIYSDAKEGDLGANLSSGSLKNSGLGKVWRVADTSNKLAVSDIAPYAPSNGDPASFMAQPIVRNGKKIGIIAIQVPTKLISNITQIRSGLGKASESYMVGPDYYMRSDSFLDPGNYSSFESFKKGNKVETDGVRRALAGETAQEIIADYRGVPVLSSFTPFKMPGSNITWALLTEIDEEEALLISNYFRNLTIVGVLAFAAFALIVGIAVGRSISNPIMKFSTYLSNSIKQVYAESKKVSQSSVSISQALTEQASSLEESSASLEEITGMVKVTTDNATEAKNMAEDMKEVSKDGIDTSRQLTSSMDQILESNADIEDLVKVIGEIGEKTSVIDEIVFQTKLLSFNASVEAERAGEHGRGFAVVAQEVGNLAEMSGRAASEISAIVGGSIENAKTIASSNKDKVVQGGDLVEKATKLFEGIDASSGNVLSKTGDISKAAIEQAGGIDQINIAISELDKVTQSNVSDVEKATGASLSLDDQVNELSDVVARLNSFILGGDSVPVGDIEEPKVSDSNVFEIQPKATDEIEVVEEAPEVEQKQEKKTASDESPKKASGGEDWETL